MTTIREFPVSQASPEAAPATAGRSINPLASILRHWRIGLAAAVLVATAGIPLAWRKGEPQWRSEGVIYVSPRLLRNLDTDPEQELQSNSQYREFVQQQVRTVTRFDIVQRALQQDGAQWWCRKGESERRAADRLRGALQISAVPDTYQITVALEGPRPEGLAETVNAVMESYLRTAKTELFFDSSARLRNLAEEKTQLERKIGGLIEERTRIAQQLGTTVFSNGLMTSYDRMLGSSSEALADARRQRFVAESNVGAKDPGQRPGPAADATALERALGDAGVSGLKSSLNQRKAELMVRMNGLGPQHSARIAAEKEIAQIDQEIERITQALRDRLAANTEVLNRARYDQAVQVERHLQADTQSLRGQAEAYSRSYQRSLELGEELERARKRLSAVEDRIGYLNLETRAPGFVRIFSPALNPDLPFQGGRKKLILIVLAAALALALAVPVGIDYLDPRVKTAAELEAFAGLPVSGWLPLVTGKGVEMDRTALLRAAISVHRNVGRLRRKVLVVSALEHGGGSSSVAMGLASTMNRLGTRTIVVEANPETPDLRYTGAAAGPGLIDLLSRHATLDQCRHAASDSLPDRMATGTGSWEDLLPAERILPLIDELLREHDLVLLDVSPLPKSVATEELVRICGSILLVVDSQRDKKVAVKKCLDRLERLAPEAFGAVLNKVSAQAGSPPWKRKHDAPSVLAA